MNSWILLLSVSLLSVTTIVSGSGSYLAAIAEHAINFGKGGESPSELLQINLDLYERHVRLAKGKNAQVIVFPEFGLTAVQGSNTSRSDLYPFAEQVPEASEQVIPCGNEHFATTSILARMSCIAKEQQILVLVNTIDWVNCNAASDSACPSDNHYQYNTDVVFDERGMIVAKYHKSHEWTPLIGPYDQVPAPTQVTYTASFGVTFGIFTCFDIMFPDPAKKLREQSISHFLYPVQQGDIGLKTIITDWSKNQVATMLAANLGAGKEDDCSGFLVNGQLLPTEKLYLGSDYPDENIIVATVPV